MMINKMYNTELRKCECDTLRKEYFIFEWILISLVHYFLGDEDDTIELEMLTMLDHFTVTSISFIQIVYSTTSRSIQLKPSIGGAVRGMIFRYQIENFCNCFVSNLI